MHFIRALVLWCFFSQRDFKCTCFSGHELEWSGVPGRTCIGRGRPEPHSHRGRPTPWRAASAPRPCCPPTQKLHPGLLRSALTGVAPGQRSALALQPLVALRDSLWSYRAERTALGSEARRASRQAGVWMTWAVWPGAPWGESGTPAWVPGHPSCGPQAGPGHQETLDMALLKEHA